MKGSFKIARIADIDVSVHFTFLLLLLWFGVSSWQESQQIKVVVSSLAFIMVLFTCVVMHEFGHALTARRFGIKTSGITLLPIGGVAALEKMPDDPKQEIMVALAGPAVNVVIAVLLWAYINFKGVVLTDQDILTGNIPFLYQIMMINMTLALFNLLPAFPMDGGRVLRASFGFFMSHNAATQKAAKIGKVLAGVLLLVGIFYNPWLILIAVFIWISASAEAGMEQVQNSLVNITAEQAMMGDFISLDSNDSLQKAIDLTLQGTQKDFPVLVDGETRFVLSQTDLLMALKQYSPQTSLRELSLPEIKIIDAQEKIQNVLKNIYDLKQPLIAVHKNGHLAGLINLDNILELIKIQNLPNSHKK